MEREEIAARLRAQFDLASKLGMKGIGQWPGEMLHVARAVADLRPRSILEIGVCEGKWPVLIAPFCAEGAQYRGLDPEAKLETFGRARAAVLSEAGMTAELIPFRSDSEEARKRLNGARFDLLHIDGDHSEKAALADWDVWAERVRPGGLVVMHDLYSEKGAGEAFAKIMDSARAERVAEFSTFCDPNQAWMMGVGILRMR